MKTEASGWAIIAVVPAQHPLPGWTLQRGQLFVRVTWTMNHFLLHILAPCHPEARLGMVRDNNGASAGVKCSACGVPIPHDSIFRTFSIIDDTPALEGWARVHFDPMDAVFAVAALQEIVRGFHGEVEGARP